jgi:hypothetical protein
MDEFIAALGKQLMTARGAESGAQGELSAARNAPMPTVNPVAEALVRSMGFAAEGLTGKTGAVQESRDLIGGQQQQLTQRRMDSLKQLEEAYQKASARADQIGDLETSLKFKKLHEKSLKDQEALLKTQALKLENTLVTQRSDREHGQALSRIITEAGLRATREKGLATSEFLWRSQQADLDRGASERKVLIEQGRDPNDPSGNTLLPASKKSQMVGALNLGFTSPESRSQQIEDMFNKSRKKGMGPGAPDKPDIKAMQVKLFDIPPDITTATRPDIVLQDFMSRLDPLGRPLYPKDKNGQLREPWRSKLNMYLNKYFPGE